jgi:uncharacterized protein YcfJ
MKNTYQLTISLLMLVVAMSAESRDYRSFRDYAPVLNVEPIVERSYEPTTRTVCDERTVITERVIPLASTIGEDIRRQMRLSREQNVCRTVTGRQPRQRVSGYRVTYRYGGRTSTARYPYDPGERIPVDVGLSPLP